jgi:hypothetical protein
MRCSEFTEFLDDYCRGTLSTDQAKLMAAHVESCETCRADYKEHQELLTLLEKEPELEIDHNELADFLPEVWQKIEQGKPSTARKWLYRLVPSLIMSTLLIFLIFRPSINQNNTDTNIESGIYSYIDQDSVYTDTTYYSLLGDVFGDNDTQTLELIEDELYTTGGLFADGNLGLEFLSDESLDRVDEKLSELINKVG